ncbi:MAG: CheR family methyltransferase [Tepidisphaeraceae bacterium]
MNGTSFPTSRGTRLRHVVFRSRVRRRVVNFATLPPGSHSSDAPALPDAMIATVAGAAPDDGKELTRAERAFVGWIFQAVGLDVGDYRVETLRRRLPACLRAVRAATLAEARQRLAAEPGLLGAAASALVIGVTGFFRDRSVFDDLARVVLPALQRDARHPRVWSAACSSGEEVYSIAMLLAEAGLLDGAALLGTDCRSAALARARDARYDARTVADVPQLWLDRYFAPDLEGDGKGWRVGFALRAAAHWRTGDLTRTVEPGGWDLILCRNVAMYLRPEVSGRLWAALESALAPGGFLVLGKAERPVGAARLSMIGPCTYRRE